jgi:AcrR family transcriptional regulator
MSAAPKAPRRTQEERTEATKGRILDATIACIIEGGYARATTVNVVKQAQVSRGALLHHFPTRATLVAEAIGHLAGERLNMLKREARRMVPQHGGTGSALDLLWGSFSGDLFQAALELWVAARTDPDLRQALVPVERTIGRRIVETARELFEPRIAERDDFDTLLFVALNTMRGIAAVQSYEPRTARPQRQWERTRATLVQLFEHALPAGAVGEVASQLPDTEASPKASRRSAGLD